MVLEMERAPMSASLAMLVLTLTVVLAPATFIFPSTSKSTPEFSFKVVGANPEPSGHFIRKNVIFRKFPKTSKICFSEKIYLGEFDLVVGLHVVAELEGGGVLATSSLIDFDLITGEEVILNELAGILANIAGLDHFDFF